MKNQYVHTRPTFLGSGEPQYTFMRTELTRTHTAQLGIGFSLFSFLLQKCTVTVTNSADSDKNQCAAKEETESTSYGGR
jgi:hypothetical protein